MLIVKTALGTVTAVVVLAVVAAATATAAAPVWQECIEIKNGRFENNKCSAKGTTKNFDWLEDNAKAKSTTSEGTVKLADTKLGTAVKCSTTGVETIGGKENASVDEVKEVKLKECSTTLGICPEPSVEAVNLPWKTELTEPTGTEIRDKVKAAKPPGFKVKCGKLLVDTCEGETSAKMTNNEKEGVVEAELEGKSEKTTCSSGGTGEATGVSKIKPTEKSIGAIKVSKPSNFKVKATKTMLLKGEKSTFTVESLVAAEATALLVNEAPLKTFKFSLPEIEFCLGKYKAKETCTFTIEYIGEKSAMFVFLVVDENQIAAGEAAFGE